LIKLYSHKASQQYITKIDRSGDVFVYSSEKDYGVYLNMNPIPVQLAKNIIEKIQFPLMWLKVPLFLLPFRLMVYEGTWTGLEYNGRAYPSHIVYGARREAPVKESIGSLIVHELGHSLCYRFVDPNFRDKKYTKKFREYMKLRGGVSDGWNDHMSTPWEKRPSELFAEDFRYLFGPDYAREEEFLHYRHIDLPGEDIRRFMLELVPEEYRSMKNRIQIIGEGVKKLNNPKYIILHHSATDADTFESIKRYHMEVRGWKDIGYHYLIEKDGALYKGRDEKTTGAHTKGMNSESIGICLVGNFDKYEPNEAQLKTLNDLISDIQYRYNIPNENIKMHRDFADYKTCPGLKFPIEEVRNMHWAEKIWHELNDMGITVHEKRFDDPVTRGEVMALILRTVKHVKEV